MEPWEMGTDLLQLRPIGFTRLGEFVATGQPVSGETQQG